MPSYSSRKIMKNAPLVLLLGGNLRHFCRAQQEITTTTTTTKNQRVNPPENQLNSATAPTHYNSNNIHQNAETDPNNDSRTNLKVELPQVDPLQDGIMIRSLPENDNKLIMFDFHPIFPQHFNSMESLNELLVFAPPPPPQQAETEVQVEVEEVVSAPVVQQIDASEDEIEEQPLQTQLGAQQEEAVKESELETMQEEDDQIITENEKQTPESEESVGDQSSLEEDIEADESIADINDGEEIESDVEVEEGKDDGNNKEEGDQSKSDTEIASNGEEAMQEQSGKEEAKSIEVVESTAEHRSTTDGGDHDEDDSNNEEEATNGEELVADESDEKDTASSESDESGGTSTEEVITGEESVTGETSAESHVVSEEDEENAVEQEAIDDQTSGESSEDHFNVSVDVAREEIDIEEGSGVASEEDSETSNTVDSTSSSQSMGEREDDAFDGDAFPANTEEENLGTNHHEDAPTQESWNDDDDALLYGDLEEVLSKLDNIQVPTDSLNVDDTSYLSQSSQQQQQQQDQSEYNNANREFVTGLDEIDKLFESVTPPDELDVGADGQSIQEVLTSQGIKIITKRAKGVWKDVQGWFENSVQKALPQLRVGHLFGAGEEDEDGDVMDIASLIQNGNGEGLLSKDWSLGGKEGDSMLIGENKNTKDESKLAVSDDESKKTGKVEDKKPSPKNESKRHERINKMQEKFPLLKTKQANKIWKFARRKWKQAKHIFDDFFSIFNDGDDDDDEFDLSSLNIDNIQSLIGKGGGVGGGTAQGQRGHILQGGEGTPDFSGKFGSEVDESFLKQRYDAMMKLQDKQ